jgi:hypothetical protein
MRSVVQAMVVLMTVTIAAYALGFLGSAAP